MEQQVSKFSVSKVAVLGAGVMGAQIAAHFNNAGFESILFDLPRERGDKNALVNQSLKQLKKMRPSPLAYPNMTGILPANYEDDLESLKNCDLVIEAISENIEHKQNLFEQISEYISTDAIIASNTSGLSIRQLVNVLPAKLRPNFCGVHFFNPPRMMQLVELIPAETTTPEVVDYLESFLSSGLGKNIIRAKDTPNFIANRVGVFALLNALHLAEKYNIGWDALDALTGVGIGRAKSATCRTIDMVGLDTFSSVVSNMAANLVDDPWRDTYRLPDSVKRLLSEGALGNKAGKGFFKRGKSSQVFCRESKTYRDVNTEIPLSITDVLAVSDPGKKLNLLRESEHPLGQFLWQHLNDVFLYCAFHVSDIADTVLDLDMAMRWGFGWQLSPFEWWQSAGWEKTTQHLNASIEQKICAASVGLPDWVNAVDRVYLPGKSFSPSSQRYKDGSSLPVYARQYQIDTVLACKAADGSHTLNETNFSRLWCEENDSVVVLSLKTKGGVVNSGVLDDINTAIDYVERLAKPLVLWQESGTFSFGADLNEFHDVFKSKDLSTLDQYINNFQRTCLRIKYCAVPIVAALEKHVLGGGCELAMHADSRVAAFETYMGLVESKVGLIPAAGGCKTLAMSAAVNASSGTLMPWVEAVFDTVANATISSSALHAKKIGLLQPGDPIVMHAGELLFVAKIRAKALYEGGYLPPRKNVAVPVVGRKGLGILKARLVNMREGGYISDHDYDVSECIATVLCGGDIDEGHLVGEEWLMSLERKSFVALFNAEKTTQRILHMLDTGRPLRN